MMRQNRVKVLLSTYNGEAYLKQLLESLINQENVDISILIRDDGSTDSTLSIIDEFISRHSNIDISLIQGKNIGYRKSFFELVRFANGADYYAFCDQDDYWLSDKLFSAVSLLSKELCTIPLLYTSNVIPVDSELKPLNNNLFKENRVLEVCESFQKSILPGCTFVFNERARNTIEKFDGYCESHDWAIYCICNTLGKVVFDNNPKILYRLHGSNTIGQSENSFFEIVEKIKRFLKKSSCARSRFASDFFACYKAEVPIECRNSIKNLGDYRFSFLSKKKLLFDKNFKGIIFKLYVLLNRV